MNVIKLNEILSGDTDKIIQVLESMGYDEIRERKGQKGSYLAFPNLDGDNKIQDKKVSKKELTNAISKLIESKNATEEQLAVISKY